MNRLTEFQRIAPQTIQLPHESARRNIGNEVISVLFQGRLVAVSFLFACFSRHFLLHGITNVVLQTQVRIELIHAPREGVVDLANEFIRADAVSTKSGAEVLCGFFEALQPLAKIQVVGVHDNV